jgi:hypothetical protein
VGDGHPKLKKIDGSGSFDVTASMEAALIGLSGRLVNVTLSDDAFGIAASPKEEVFRVWYDGESNSCPISKNDAETVCKFDQSDCCIFLSVSLAIGAQGYGCEKFNTPLALVLLDGIAHGTSGPTRIGSCKLCGRKSAR